MTDVRNIFSYVLLSLNLWVSRGQFYDVPGNFYPDVPEVGLSQFDGYQVGDSRQFGQQVNQPYDGFVDYDLPVVGEVGQYPVQPEYPPVVAEYPVLDYQVPVYDGWAPAEDYGWSPCNPSPSRYLLPPLLPDCGDYYDCLYQPPDPCSDCPCIQYTNPCPPPYYCPPPTAPPPPRPHPVTTTSSTSSCALETGEREGLMVSLDGVLLWVSAPVRDLSWYRADSLAAVLGRETKDWRLAELNTMEQVENLEVLLNREGCSLSSLGLWLGGNRLADSQWRWTGGETVTGDLWRGQTPGDCMMLRDKHWRQENCSGGQQGLTGLLAQKDPPPTFLPTNRPTAQPSSPPPTVRPTVEQSTEIFTTPIDTNLPPGPD